ncbi:MAG: NUDIX hydrolase [Acidobacteria bacterium]|nr:NUDIX hydrolase [Acidobacteriota bacterium]
MPIVYRSRVFDIEVDLVTLMNDREHEVATVRHAPSVVLLPVQEDGRLILVRQYRHSAGRELWELPAGSIEPGESPEAAAARECEEEIALRPGRIERLGAFYPAPGYCDERLMFFRVSDLEQPPAESPHHPDEDEEIYAQAFTIDAARGMVARGEIVDLKTAYGLTLL